MFWIMRKANTESLRTLVPVHGTHGCAGHLLRSAKGFRAYDSDNREIGGSEGFDSFVGRAVLQPQQNKCCNFRIAIASLRS